MSILPVVWVILAVSVGCQAQSITSTIVARGFSIAAACGNFDLTAGVPVYIDWKPTSNARGLIYTTGCEFDDLPRGGPKVPCPNYPDPSDWSYRDFDPNTGVASTVRVAYDFPAPGVYTLLLFCNEAQCGHHDYTAGQGACGLNDPVIVGFDGSVFHFDNAGEYAMLESGDGYKVYSTFTGATATNEKQEVEQKSWTSSVRVFSPNGDMVSCALPAIRPNTSRIQVTSSRGLDTTLLSVTKPTTDLAEVSASVVLAQDADSSKVVGCVLTTPYLEIRVDQVSGYQQALMHPDTEGWAAPFTWLDTRFSVLKPLTAPVTGIIGATYPVDDVDMEHFDREHGGAGVTASMTGEGLALQTHQRALLSKDSTAFTAELLGRKPRPLPAK